MLLLLIMILSVATGWLLVKRRYRWGAVVVIVLVACQAWALLDAQHHFGTTRRVQTTTERIAPVTQVKGNAILVTTALKKGKTHYTAYATRSARTHRVQVVLNRQKRVVIAKTKFEPVKKTQNWVYQYKRTGLKWWFAGITNAGQLQRQTVTYQLPANWLRLTKSQLTQLGQLLKQPRTQKQLQVTVKAEVMRQLRAHLGTNRTQLQQRAEQRAVRQVIEAHFKQS